MLPEFLKKYFWGDNLDQLSFDNNKKYITQTVLDKGDKFALMWLFSKISKDEVKKSSGFKDD